MEPYTCECWREGDWFSFAMWCLSHNLAQAGAMAFCDKTSYDDGWSAAKDEYQ